MISMKGASGISTSARTPRNLIDKLQPLRLLEQQRRDDKGEPSIEDEHAVPQRVEAIFADIGERTNEPPANQKREHEVRQRGKTGNGTAREEKGDNAKGKYDLADIKWRHADIGDGLAEERIADQQRAERDQIVVAERGTRRGGLLD